MIKKRSAFTLVELIVVVTILAILGTIAFLSFQGYSSDARDSTRTTDLSSIKISLEVFNTKVGGYPFPTSYTGITYSGGLVWNQGTFGMEPFKQLGDINKVPLDPLTSNEYTYSITNTKGEYELAVVYEGTVAKNKEILNQVNAGKIQGNIKIMGSYNGVYVMTNTGGTNFTIFTPTIINGDMSVLDLPSMISGGKIVVMGGTKLPDSYKNSNFKNEDFSTQIGSNIIISTGSLFELKANTQSGVNLRQEYLTTLKSILSGTTVENNYKELINTTSDHLVLNLVSGKWKINVYNGTFAINNPSSGGGGGGGGGCSLSAVLGTNTIANCTTQGEILSANSSYCSCDSPDIIVCTGVGAGHILSACNVGTDTSGTGSSSYGNYFQFGRNKGFTSSSPIHSSQIPVDVNTTSDTYDFVFNSSYTTWSTTDANDNWGGVSNDTNLTKGPCITGYHVPTMSEWNSIKDSLYTFYTSSDGSLFRDSLLMPFASARRFWNDGIIGDYTTGYYWTRIQDSSPVEAFHFWIDNGNSSNNSYAYMVDGLSVRCFKN